MLNKMIQSVRRDINSHPLEQLIKKNTLSIITYVSAVSFGVINRNSTQSFLELSIDTNGSH